MKAILPCMVLAICLAGCGGPAKQEALVPKPAMSGPPGAAPSNNGGGIAPIGPNVGGMTPVAGGENLGGGTGGAIGGVAKNRARALAQQNSSAPPGEDETGGQ